MAELNLIKKPDPTMNELPSNVQEFQNCDSHYQIPEKEESFEISSDGEFNDANHILVLDDDCTQVLEIDVHKEISKQNGRGYKDEELPPNYLQELRDHGTKSHREKVGTKYFKKVGYIGDNDREVPRWAANTEETVKIKAWQRDNMNAETVFGYLDPRKLTGKVQLDKMFTMG
jgi:hypothetical protein